MLFGLVLLWVLFGFEFVRLVCLYLIELLLVVGLWLSGNLLFCVLLLFFVFVWFADLFTLIRCYWFSTWFNVVFPCVCFVYAVWFSRFRLVCLIVDNSVEYFDRLDYVAALMLCFIVCGCVFVFTVFVCVVFRLVVICAVVVLFDFSSFVFAVILCFAWWLALIMLYWFWLVWLFWLGLVFWLRV